MRGPCMILSLLLVACTYAIKVPTDGKIVTLIPQTGTGVKETFWELITERGSKMVLICLFKTYSCRLGAIKVFDGEYLSQHCPEVGQLVLRNSVRDKMSVTILNSGKSAVAYCQVTATKPYIDMPEPVIDSSEHGTSKSATCGRRNHPVRRIVNGKLAGINEFTFAGLLMFFDTRFPFCGCSIITERHALTAAHCTDPFKDRLLAVVVGEHDVRTYKETQYTEVHKVLRILQHPDYSNKKNKADITVVELSTVIKFHNFVGPVCLPNAQKNLIDEIVKVMGWGLTRDKSEGGKASAELRHVNLRIIDPDVCKVIYGIDTTELTQICTYNNEKDSCQGDSGGPLVHEENGRYVQVALVSYGRKCGSTDPAVNTDVAFYMPWIKEQISKCSHRVNLRHA
uniref:Venom S1 protease 1 n=1 Tax=Ectomocoris sp. TaxID=3104572 RepID=A0AB38ZE43_9HEMI